MATMAAASALKLFNNIYHICMHKSFKILLNHGKCRILKTFSILLGAIDELSPL